MFRYYLINSKLYISLAAVALTVGTQIQLGGQPAMHPYLFIVFFATFLEYNLTRLIVLVGYKMPLENPNDIWVNKHLKIFYFAMALASIGLLIALFYAKIIVLMSLIPMIVITALYTLPFLRLRQLDFNIRRIPFLKIVLIMVVWTFSTVMLPILQLDNSYNWKTTCLLLLERSLLIGSLALIFDVRDLIIDRKIGLKTIPVILGERWSIFIANAMVVGFLCVSYFYYQLSNTDFLMPAALLSFIVLLILINHPKIRLSKFYHYFYIDGAMLLHGILIVLVYFFH
ncbi:MAG: UbiA family prenyltransferase [bacterium]|nr:UbiA family prenyltransferase [bacterium]